LKALERQTAVLQAVGRLEGLTAELDLLKSRLAAVPLWRPAAGLLRQCEEALRMIRGISARLERSLVVTVIGPSGSGKSTLVNALAGGDELSPAGRRRPTTGKLILLGAGGEDAVELARELGEDAVELKPAAGGNFPAGLCLIDTPDTDSTEFRRHIPALERVIGHSDVLVCVFDAENPKRRDHADFLAPFVQRFDGESLVAVLNKCDRLDLQELKDSILPDFLEYLQAAWGGALDQTLCLCARRHVRQPGWDPAAEPRHDFDQFAELQRLLFGGVAQGRFVIDRRVENARQLHAFVASEAGREINADRPAWEAARQTLAALEAEALTAAVSALRGGEGRWASGVGLTVCQKLSRRWVGPVGWMLALWTRLVMLGSGVASFWRRGRRFGLGPPPGSEGTGTLMASDQLEAAQRSYRIALLRRWPEAAELLVRGRFDPAVRRNDSAASASEQAAEQLAGLWADSVGREIERVSGRLGGLGLQMLLNAPVIGILAYVGWVTVGTFFRADYLGGEYFLHAFWVIAIALVLSFFALQILIRTAAGAGRIAARALKRLPQDLEKLDGPATGPVRSQLEALLQLAAAARE
jgi:energy-coupling factor transporter ATP-binding protein EcfA2